MPAGPYEVEWIDTKDGQIEKDESVRHDGAFLSLQAPEYRDDIALRIKRAIE
jgi:hypothetical protein